MNPITLTGLSTTVLDFTNVLSPLLAGLIGLVGCSAAAIIYSAIRHHRTQVTIAVPHAMSPTAVQQKAA